jgi:hypothetical protein
MCELKPTISLLVCAMLTLGTLGCGKTGGDSEKHSLRSSPAAVLPKIETKTDPDEDSDRYPKEQPDRDELPDYKTEPFGHPADAADTRAVTALVKRYYADAAREDGAAACGLLYAPREETIAAEYGGSGSATGKQSVTCGPALSGLFKELHGVLEADSAKLRVTAVRVELNRGSVQLHLAHVSVPHYIGVHRERGVWKMEMLVDIDHPVGAE